LVSFAFAGFPILSNPSQANMMINMMSLYSLFPETPAPEKLPFGIGGIVHPVTEWSAG